MPSIVGGSLAMVSAWMFSCCCVRFSYDQNLGTSAVPYICRGALRICRFHVVGPLRRLRELDSEENFGTAVVLGFLPLIFPP